MNPDETIITGPAFIYGSAISTTAGRAVFTKSPITIRRVTTPTVISTDAVQNIDQRLNTLVHEVTFTPSGRAAEVVDLLTPAWSLYPGQKVMQETSVAVASVATASAGTKISVTLSSATVCHVGQYVTLTGMSVSAYNGTWLVSTVTSSTVIVLDKAYVSTATGTCRVPKCLIIHPLRADAPGTKIRVYQFAGITSYPELTLSAVETSLGATTLSCIEHPHRWGNDVSEALFKELTWAAPSSALLELLEAGDIPTIAPRVRFAEASVDAFTGSDPASDPWKEFSTLDGVKVTTSLNATAQTTDAKGFSNWVVQSVGMSATCTPVGEDIAAGDVDTLLAHNTGNGRGRTLTADVLEFSALIEDAATTYLLTIPRAVPVQAEAAFGATAARNGAISFNAVRTITTGAENPLSEWEEV